MRSFLMFAFAVGSVGCGPHFVGSDADPDAGSTSTTGGRPGCDGVCAALPRGDARALGGTAGTEDSGVSGKCGGCADAGAAGEPGTGGTAGDAPIGGAGGDDDGSGGSDPITGGSSGAGGAGGTSGASGSSGANTGGSAGSTDPVNDGECDSTGIRASINPVGGQAVLGAEIAIGSPAILRPATDCAGDLNPAVGLYECCLTNAVIPSGTQVCWVFGLAPQSRSCTTGSQPCGSLGQYHATVNGQDRTTTLEATLLPQGCQGRECYALCTTAP